MKQFRLERYKKRAYKKLGIYMKRKKLSVSMTKADKNPTGGLSEKGRKYNRATGSNLKRPVTAKKLNEVVKMLREESPFVLV